MVFSCLCFFFFFFNDPAPPEISPLPLHRRSSDPHAALASLGLRGFPKTSGATGIQVYVPVAPGHTYAQTRGVAGAVARLIEAADPQDVTLEWDRSEEHTSELQSRLHLVCRLLLEK